MRMKCPICQGEDFIIESTIVITEIYTISNKGKVSKRPRNIEVSNEDMAEFDNQIRCTTCNQAYVIEVDDSCRDFYLSKDYLDFDLNQKEVKTSEY